MTLILKTLQINSEMVETWHGIIISHTYHVLKSWEGYGKNGMHFVYKLDHLFRSIRVSDENSSVTKTLNFFEIISTPIFLCVQLEPIKDTSYNFKPFWLHLLVFMHLVIYFELNNPQIENHYRSTQKWLKLGMVS